MIAGFPHDAFPAGWFQVAWSSEIAPDAVTALRYFGRDLVAYRGESGVHVIDAHCPHMGAHLGFGGSVEDDDIRCGFHGWCFGPDGRNTEVPYGSRETLNVSIRTYPIVEIEGLVFAWFHPAGAAPDWDPPDLTASLEGQRYFDLFPHCARGDTMRVQPQMIVENTVDFPHLVWTHRWTAGEPSLVRCEADGHRFTAQLRGYLPTPKGTATMDVTQQMHGVGIIVAPITGVRDVLQVVAITPIDHDHSYVRLSTFVSCPEGVNPSAPDRVAVAIVEAQCREVIGHTADGDRKIWEHMRYVERPPLVPEEADGTRAIRRWAEQFYRVG